MHDAYISIFKGEVRKEECIASRKTKANQNSGSTYFRKSRPHDESEGLALLA